VKRRRRFARSCIQGRKKQKLRIGGIIRFFRRLINDVPLSEHKTPELGFEFVKYVRNEGPPPDESSVLFALRIIDVAHL
jgi:hypothetical protein